MDSEERQVSIRLRTPDIKKRRSVEKEGEREVSFQGH